ncbi:hypothetical protein E3N88_04589 [Mikania micrantha]|uniref:Uncharacterized protein n=1 Tax=Mikania micrantha TaxID=192012 RepID=A0A5N6PWY0_9ASTR|nr:hypothetical protein E3N88_04589 [Mikania micrantha]
MDGCSWSLVLQSKLQQLWWMANRHLRNYLRQVVAPTDAAVASNTLQRILKGRFMVEIFLLDIKIRKEFFLYVLLPFRDEHGKIIGILGPKWITPKALSNKEADESLCSSARLSIDHLEGLFDD